MIAELVAQCVRERYKHIVGGRGKQAPPQFLKDLVCLPLVHDAEFTHKRIVGLWDRSTAAEKLGFWRQANLLELDTEDAGPRDPCLDLSPDFTGDAFSRRLLLQPWVSITATSFGVVVDEHSD